MIGSNLRRKPIRIGGLQLLGVLAMTAGLSATSAAGPISFNWFVEPYAPDFGGPVDPDRFVVYGELFLAPDWYFGAISVDALSNAHQESLGMESVPGESHFSWNDANNGGGAFFPLTILVIPPGTRPGLYDRAYSFDGSWRPSAIRVSAIYGGSDPDVNADEEGILELPFDFAVLDQSGGPGGDPGVVPEPASLAMGAVAAAGVAVLLRRRRATA